MQFKNWQDAQSNGVRIKIDQTTPRKPDELDYDPSASNYLWPITPKEHDLVMDLLEVQDPDFKAPNVWVTVPQYYCTGCGKLAGFADSVFTALIDRVHTKKFMINALKRSLTNDQPPRFVKYVFYPYLENNMLIHTDVRRVQLRLHISWAGQQILAGMSVVRTSYVASFQENLGSTVALTTRDLGRISIRARRLISRSHGRRKGCGKDEDTFIFFLTYVLV